MTALQPRVTIGAYESFNRNADRGTLIWQWSKRGFGSEMVVMLLAMLFAAEHRIQFRLCSRFGNIGFRHGWRDYFEPFCPETVNPLLSRSFLRKPMSFGARLLSLAGPAVALTRNVQLTHEVFPHLWRSSFADRAVTIPELNIDSTPVVDVCSAFLDMLWRFRPQTHNAIEHALQPLKLGSAPFAAIHVRRGDKLINEAVEVPLAHYINAVRDAMPSVQRIFVATDTYAVVAECRSNWPEIDFLTLCEPEQQGHLQRAFNRQSRRQRYEQTLALLADITALRRSDYFVGTFTSNLGRLVALLRGLDHCRGMDGPFSLVHRL